MGLNLNIRCSVHKKRLLNQRCEKRTDNFGTKVFFIYMFFEGKNEREIFLFILHNTEGYSPSSYHL